jgi:flagellar hook-associated protein 3 FlgL
MSSVSIGDMAQMFLLKRQNTQVKQDMAELSIELTSGLAADKAKHLSGDFSPLASLMSTLAQLDGYASVNTETGLFAEAMQTALQTIDSQTGSLSSTLLTASAGGAGTSMDAVGYGADQVFRSAISALNTRFGDRSIFAGQRTDAAALVDADTIFQDLEALTASALSPTDVTDALDAYFADGGQFDTTAYTGGPQMAGVSVAPGETAKLDITATDPTVKKTLRALAMGALLAHGVMPSNPAGRAELAKLSGEALMATQTDRAQLSAHLGTTQARIIDADTRNQAQITSLQIAQVGMLSVDPYETASKLQAAQAQLETLYTITARMSHLHLTDYL